MFKQLRLVLVSLALLVMAAFVFAKDTDHPHISGEIIVGLSAGTTVTQAEAFANKHGLELKQVMLTPGLFLFSVPDPESANVLSETQEKLNAARLDPAVHYASVNFILEKHQIPNDPLFGVAANRQWMYFQIGLPGPNGAWSIHRGAPDVLVAILDDAFHLEHPDLMDQNEMVRWRDPWNAFDNNNDPRPPTADHSHGTMVISPIVAGTNNSIGMAAIAWENVMAVPIRISTDTGALSGAAYFNGLQYIINYNNDPGTPTIAAVNMSFGRNGGGIDPTELALLTQVRNQGTILVAAAGNSRPFPAGWPASYSNVISVGATRFVTTALNKGYHTSYSSPGSPGGPEKVDFGAPSSDPPNPGAAMMLTLDDNYSGGGGGTSYASPVFAASVALLISAGMQHDEVYDAFRETAVVRPGDSVPNLDTGWGEIDVGAAILLAGGSIRIISPVEDAKFNYRRMQVQAHLRNIRSAGPAPTVTYERIDGGTGPIVVGPADITIVPTPNPTTELLTANLRLVDGNGVSEGVWKVTVTGTQQLPYTLEVSDSVTFRMERPVILAGTNMYSIPYDLVQPGGPVGGFKPEDFFGVNFTQFRWIPTLDGLGQPTGDYHQYNPALPNTQPAGLTPSDAEITRRAQVGGVPVNTSHNGPWGVGLWVRNEDTAVLDWENGPEPGLIYYRIKLKPGWNQIGNPYGHGVPWVSCQIVELPSNQLWSIEQAAARNIIRPQLFRYQLVGGGVKDYRWFSPPNGNLFSFESHWVYAIQECWLQVNPVAVPDLGQLTWSGSVRGQGWLMQVGVGSDTANYFGVTADLNSNFDVVPKPPGVPQQVSGWFVSSNGQALAQDLRELSQGRETWRFTVRPAAPNQELVLNWKPVVNPSSRLRMTLRDDATGRTLSMTRTMNYAFTADEQASPRTFTIVVEPDVAGRLVIAGVRVSGGGRETGQFGIQYSLSADADVSIRILSVNGRVQTELMTGRTGAGSNSVTWNGRDARGAAVAPGVYIVEITAETESGERARTTVPLTVTR